MNFKPEFLMIPFVITMLLGVYLSNMIVVFIAFLILIGMFISKRIISDKTNVQTSESATSIFNKYEISKYHIGTDNLSCIGIDESNNKIVFLSRENTSEKFNVSHIPFQDLFEVKINEDELTVTSVSRASQVGGALVGGLVAGGIGAIVGGMGGSQQSENEIRKIELELTVNNLQNPIHKVSFLNEEIFIKKYDPKYKEQFEIANNWSKTLSVILKRNEINMKMS